MDQGDQIEKILGEVNGRNNFNGITKQHWKPSNLQDHCTECKKSFSLTNRVHHCRRCGNLFCKVCVSYERRLNIIARPDPNGRLYKVCKACYDQGPQSVGFSKSWTHVFKAYKLNVDSVDYIGRVTSQNFRERLNLHKECERLKAGFLQSINKSSLKKTLSGLKGLVVSPEWQKSPYTLLANFSTKCYICNKPFSINWSKCSCVVCGVVVCTSCSTKDLLVYIPDDIEIEGKRPCLTIIKIVGCPPKEPVQCMYLRVCSLCQQNLEDVQVAKYKKNLSDMSDQKGDLWLEMDKGNEQFKELEAKIEEHLPVYQDLVEFVDTGIQTDNVKKDRSHTQTLAKAQCDLSDHLAKYVMQIYKFKETKPIAGIQMTIYKNIVRSKCEFYQENMFIFREAKRRLAETTPQEVLECIQTKVDNNAINSCYLTLRQLALESLKLYTKHKLESDLPNKLAVLDSVLEEDLKVSLLKSNQNSRISDMDWETHSKCTNQLIKERLSHGHRFIRPSSRKTQEQGTKHIFDIVTYRSHIILKQSLLQLQSKSKHNSFSNSKEILKTLVEQGTKLN